MLSLALLLVVLGSLVIELSNNVRGLDTWPLLTLTVMGLLIEWGLGASSLPGWLAWLLTSALGTGVVLFRTGRLGRKVGEVLPVLGDLALEIWHWGWGGPSPSWTSVPLALMELWTDAVTLLDRGVGGYWHCLWEIGFLIRWQWCWYGVWRCGQSLPGRAGWCADTIGHCGESSRPVRCSRPRSSIQGRAPMSCCF